MVGDCLLEEAIVHQVEALVRQVVGEGKVGDHLPVAVADHTMEADGNQVEGTVVYVVEEVQVEVGSTADNNP